MAESSLIRRIEQLEDIETIRRLVARYALGADRQNDPEIMGPMFSDDAIWEAAGFGRYVGAQNIASGLADIARKTIRWSLHYMVSPLIELSEEPGRATCHWYLWELARVAQGDGEPRAHWIGGWYESQLVKRLDAWKFQHVVLHPKLISPLESDWSTLP